MISEAEVEAVKEEVEAVVEAIKALGFHVENSRSRPGTVYYVFATSNCYWSGPVTTIHATDPLTAIADCLRWRKAR